MRLLASTKITAALAGDRPLRDRYGSMTNHNEIDPTKVASAALASVVLLMAALASSPVASADSVTDQCYDWMKIANDSVTGEQMFCAAPGTPATKLSWQPWSKGAWGSLSIVGSAGSPCRAPSATFAQFERRLRGVVRRSSDDHEGLASRRPAHRSYFRSTLECVRAVARVSRHSGGSCRKERRITEDADKSVSNQTTYESLKTAYRRWHGDMTDIADQR